MAEQTEELLPKEIYAMRRDHGRYGGNYANYPVASELAVKYVRADLQTDAALVQKDRFARKDEA